MPTATSSSPFNIIESADLIPFTAGDVATPRSHDLPGLMLDVSYTVQGCEWRLGQWYVSLKEVGPTPPTYPAAQLRLLGHFNHSPAPRPSSSSDSTAEMPDCNPVTVVDGACLRVPAQSPNYASSLAEPSDVAPASDVFRQQIRRSHVSSTQ